MKVPCESCEAAFLRSSDTHAIRISLIIILLENVGKFMTEELGKFHKSMKDVKKKYNLMI